MIKATEIVYISGPMTGIDNLNRDKFNQIENHLKHRYQCRVLNPATLPQGLTYEQYMKIDIGALVKSDVIIMLTGWQQSKGAVMEQQVAAICGLCVIDELDLIPTCRVCGCTDDNACPGGCSWIKPNLCSQCVEANNGST